jgi:hypothetical protein
MLGLNTVVANWFLEKIDEVEKEEIKGNGTPECRVRTSNTKSTLHSCRIIIHAASRGFENAIGDCLAWNAVPVTDAHCAT